MAVLNDRQKRQLDRGGVIPHAVKLGSRLANLDSDGTYTGDLGSTGNLTTATDWIVNSDSTHPKLKLSAPDTGTGDYTLTLAAPATLAANRTITIPDPGAATANLAYGDSSGKTAVANLAAAVQDMLPTVTIAAGAESTDTRTITVTVKDAAGNALAAHSFIKVWVSTTSYGAPSASGNTVGNVSAGTTIQEITANALYDAKTENTGGTYVFDLTVSGNADRYVMVAVGGRVYASSVIAFTA